MCSKAQLHRDEKAGRKPPLSAFCFCVNSDAEGRIWTCHFFLQITITCQGSVLFLEELTLLKLCSLLHRHPPQLAKLSLTGWPPTSTPILFLSGSQSTDLNKHYPSRELVCFKGNYKHPRLSKSHLGPVTKINNKLGGFLILFLPPEKGKKRWAQEKGDDRYGNKKKRKF